MLRRRLFIVVGVLLLGFVMGVATTYTMERHPEIRAAQRDLASAMAHLNRGAHDFGGHRVRAMDHIRQAQDELRAALGYRRR